MRAQVQSDDAIGDPTFVVEATRLGPSPRERPVLHPFEAVRRRRALIKMAEHRNICAERAQLSEELMARVAAAS